MRLITALALGLSLVVGAFAQDPAELKAKKAEMVKLEATYKRAKTAGEKAKPGSPKQKAYIDATVAYGNCVLVSPVLTPKEKYPKALSLYREALKVDPKNKVALENKNMIEQIYKSMNRPIPKG